ncbi:hypothetical protein ADL28_28315 [Streptomyces violaceusniger]|uniref:Uncharacterized protein n=1 Tax=Streptomyces violaceusniger TaxID=68280 RepID=A0A0X3VVI3_STRVO|nr:hypothetical protein ADL28_28315 [Streptomyces violaceusniger]
MGAVVNDGRHTTLYVHGCPVARDPSTPATGLTTLGLLRLLGGYEYGGKIDQIMHGWIGDVRLVDRALPVRDFIVLPTKGSGGSSGPSGPSWSPRSPGLSASGCTSRRCPA